VLATLSCTALAPSACRATTPSAGRACAHAGQACPSLAGLPHPHRRRNTALVAAVPMTNADTLDQILSSRKLWNI
jgi:hypothetical protein